MALFNNRSKPQIKTPIDMLKAARQLITAKKHWCKGSYHSSHGGTEMWCAVGALQHQIPLAQDNDRRLYNKAHELLKHELLKNVVPSNAFQVESFNDSIYTEHARVLALFDRAIETAESKCATIKKELANA